MYLYKVILTPNSSKFKMSKSIENIIFEYMGVLYKNGQVMYNYEVVKEETSYCVYCKFPEKTSLNKENNNRYVNEYYNKIKEIFKDELKYIGDDIEEDNICSCESTSWYMLYASYLEGETPIVCGDCGKSVPLYRLPKIMRQEEYLQELYWQRDYQNIDSLYISGLSDRFTYRQMNNPDSQLSKNGREICSEFEKVLKKPFYYYLANFKENLQKCPICGEAWEKNEKPKIVDFKCYNCRLVTDKE